MLLDFLSRRRRMAPSMGAPQDNSLHGQPHEGERRGQPEAPELSREAFAQSQEHAWALNQKLRGMTADEQMRALCEGQPDDKIDSRIEQLRFFISILYFENSDALRRTVTEMLRFRRQKQTPKLLTGVRHVLGIVPDAENNALQLDVRYSGAELSDVQRETLPLPEIDRIYLVTTSDDPRTDTAFAEIYTADVCYLFPARTPMFDVFLDAVRETISLDWAVLDFAMQCAEDADFLLFRRQTVDS